MLNSVFQTETICAISTPHGQGGISVLRISGEKSLEVARELCPFLPAQVASHRAYHGFLMTRDRLSKIDEVLVLYFEKGKSYTGEETVEISCHGSPIICEKILEEIIALGGRLSNRGEFTYRAFMNGKIDLVQAESVLSIIESQSRRGADLALRQLEGGLSKKISEIEQEMTWLLAHLEASIDFSEEGLEVVGSEELQTRLNFVKNSLSHLVGGFSQGRLLKDGVRVLLLGRPNVGKSSLFNCFLQKQRAIVTDIPGTTRDLIDGSFAFNGVKLTFIDTAGIRDIYSDEIEKIGVRRSSEAIADSDVVLFVLDASKGVLSEDKEIFQTIRERNPVVLINKIDLIKTNQEKEDLFLLIRKELGSPNPIFPISSFAEEGRSLVLDHLIKSFKVDDFRLELLVSNARQADLLKEALCLVEKTISQSALRFGAEFLVIDLKEALLKVQEVLGKHYDDQILDRIFKEFCIGK